MFVVGYVAVFFMLAKRIYDGFGNSTHEISAANNLMWWMVRGHPYRFSLLNDLSYLGIHVELFWPVVAIVYTIVPGVYTLLFCQSLALGLCAVPVYLIVRRLWESEVAGVLMGIAFTLFPPIAAGNLNQVHPVSYIPVFLLWAAYFFYVRKLGWFVCFSIVASLVRENVCLGICMFGIWAWAERRPWKWRLLPLLGGIGYFLLATKVIIPWGLQGRTWHVAGYFTYLGNSPGEIVQRAVTQPALVLGHLLEGANIQYFILLTQSVFWVMPFGHWAVLLGVPDLAANLLSDNGGMKVISWHYQFMAATGLFLGATFTMKRLLNELRRRFGAGYFAISLAGLAVILCLSQWFLWLQPQLFVPLPHRESLLRALRVVPPEKSVLAPSRLQGWISAREHFGDLPRLVNNPPYAAQFEYVVLDANERQYPPAITQAFFDAFQTNQIYQLVFAENNVFVFQRRGGESDWKIQPSSLGN